MTYLYISYASENWHYVRLLADALIESGCNVWIDKNRWDTSEAHWAVLERAVSDAAALIVVMTPDSQRLKRVRRETDLAIELGKPIFPMLLQGEVWERFYAAPVQDVRNGDLPSFMFFDYLKIHVPCNTEGKDVTMALSVHSVIDGNMQPVARPIRILIADDHDMVRVGLMAFIGVYDDLLVVGDTKNGEIAVQLCQSLKPDVVLLDFMMPGLDGPEAARQMLKTCPNVKIILLTNFSDERHIREGLRAGASSYLLKNVTGEELANIVRSTHGGQSTLSPEVARVLIEATMRPPALGHDLTQRELDVLTLMIKGLNNHQIGEKLSLSSSTIKNHVSNILSKLGTDSRTHAVAVAIERKIVDTRD